MKSHVLYQMRCRGSLRGSVRCRLICKPVCFQCLHLRLPRWFGRFEQLRFVLPNPGASSVILGQASQAALPKQLIARCCIAPGLQWLFLNLNISLGARVALRSWGCFCSSPDCRAHRGFPLHEMSKYALEKQKTKPTSPTPG